MGRGPQRTRFSGRRAPIEGTSRPAGGRPEGDLEARVRRQEAVAKLGMSALSGTGIPDLLEEAVVLVARTLGVGYVKVLELLPDGDALVLAAIFVFVGQCSRRLAADGSSSGFCIRV